MWEPIVKHCINAVSGVCCVRVCVCLHMLASGCHPVDSRWLHVVFMLTCSPYQDVGVAAAVVTEEDKLRAMIEDETDKNQQARCVYLNCVCGCVGVCMWVCTDIQVIFIQYIMHTFLLEKLLESLIYVRMYLGCIPSRNGRTNGTSNRNLLLITPVIAVGGRIIIEYNAPKER